MSIENPLWGAPRIHGELLKLGLDVAQSSVAKYMVKRRGAAQPGMANFRGVLGRFRNRSQIRNALESFGYGHDDRTA
jgi:hypothetical protein